MENSNELNLKSVMILEEDGGYVVDTYPMPHAMDELILSEDKAGRKRISSCKSSEKLTVPKTTLEALSYAYVFMKNGEKYGTAVRILTRPPKVRRLILQPDGRIGVVLKDRDDYTAQAGLDFKITEDGRERGETRLRSGETELNLAQIGIDGREKTAIVINMGFCMTDANQTAIFGPTAAFDMVINPPEVTQLVREESQIKLKLSKEPALPLYAEIYQNGQEVFHMLSCQKETAGEYVILTDTMNLQDASYAVTVACANELTMSYWSAPYPLITTRPVVQSIVTGGREMTVRMQQKGYYCWAGQYGWTDEIKIPALQEVDIRYASRCGDTVSLGMPASVTGQDNQEYFAVKDGYYYRTGRQECCSLSEVYTAAQYTSFAIEQKEKSWQLIVRKEHNETMCHDWKKLLIQECTSYAQIEELTSCFGEMFLRPEDMLAVCYGYEPQRGACDIRAGMLLCVEYAQYQNIPESDRETVEEEPLSDRNLSGFTGNGSGVFQSILRNGKVTFEPMAQAAAEQGRLAVEAPELAQDGRISMEAGIWDTLFEQFQVPFVKLLYPAVWRQSGHLNHGSMYYYDNVCLVAAGSYAQLEEAVERYLHSEKPYDQAAYVCFRGRTAVRIMIHIFVEGQPQTCALGTTLGDIVASYGLGGRIVLERMYKGDMLAFAVSDRTIPLYIGDRICSR